jgi:hypothetical protein
MCNSWETHAVGQLDGLEHGEHPGTTITTVFLLCAYLQLDQVAPKLGELAQHTPIRVHSQNPQAVVQLDMHGEGR